MFWEEHRSRKSLTKITYSNSKTCTTHCICHLMSFWVSFATPRAILKCWVLLSFPISIWLRDSSSLEMISSICTSCRMKSYLVNQNTSSTKEWKTFTSIICQRRIKDKHLQIRKLALGHFKIQEITRNQPSRQDIVRANKRLTLKLLTRTNKEFLKWIFRPNIMRRIS